MRLNELKAKAQEKINALKEQFETQENGACELDLTRSAYPIEMGTRHPLSIVKNEIIDIFARLGFSIAEGPEIEDDWHVFSALNFAEDHPARDMQDTFSLNHTRIFYCVHILHPCRHVPWKYPNLLSALSVRGACTVTRRSVIVHIVSSTK